MPVEDHEALGREVFSKRRAKKAKSGNVPIDIFETGAQELSVDRLDVGPPEELVQIAERNGSATGRPFFGWVSVFASSARQMGRIVRESPTLENPYHADIVIPLPVDVFEHKDILRQHALNLRQSAIFRDAEEFR